MRGTCVHAHGMSVMIQIRNVPDEIHRELKVRAARAGRSLSDFLLEELRDLATRPTPEEIIARIEASGRIEEDLDIAGAVRAERDAR
jgi:plasmid stability protein